MYFSLLPACSSALPESPLTQEMEQLGTAVQNLLQDEVEMPIECYAAKREEMEGNIIPPTI
jgi:hypothetical protein